MTGVGTRFREQLKAGDRVVIRGMTHVVAGVASNTSMNVTPDYRGVNTSAGVKICAVVDKKAKQSEPIEIRWMAQVLVDTIGTYPRCR